MKNIAVFALLVLVKADVSHLKLNTERQYLPPVQSGYTDHKLKPPHETRHYVISKPRAIPDPPSVVVPRSNLHTFVADLPLRQRLFTPAGSDPIQQAGSDHVVYAAAPNSVFHTQINVQSQGSEFNAPSTVPIEVDTEDSRTARVGNFANDANYNSYPSRSGFDHYDRHSIHEDPNRQLNHKYDHNEDHQKSFQGLRSYYSTKSPTTYRQDVNHKIEDYDRFQNDRKSYDGHDGKKGNDKKYYDSHNENKGHDSQDTDHRSYHDSRKHYDSHNEKKGNDNHGTDHRSYHDDRNHYDSYNEKKDNDNHGTDHRTYHDGRKHYDSHSEKKGNDNHGTDHRSYHDDRKHNDDQFKKNDYKNRDSDHKINNHRNDHVNRKQYDDQDGRKNYNERTYDHNIEGKKTYETNDHIKKSNDHYSRNRHNDYKNNYSHDYTYKTTDYHSYRKEELAHDNNGYGTRKADPHSFGNERKTYDGHNNQKDQPHNHDHSRSHDKRKKTENHQKRPNYQGVNLINGNIAANQASLLPQPPQNFNGNAQGINIINGNILGSSAQSRQYQDGRNHQQRTYEDHKHHRTIHREHYEEYKERPEKEERGTHYTEKDRQFAASDRSVISPSAIKIIAFNNNNPPLSQIRAPFSFSNAEPEFELSASAPEVIYKSGDEIDFAETKLVDYTDNRRPLDSYKFDGKRGPHRKETDLREDGYHYSKPSITFDS